MIAGGVREEIQRGFILHRFRQYLGGGVIGVIVHSGLFGLGHVDQGWDAAITVGTLGAIWGTSISSGAASSRRWSATPASTWRSSSSSWRCSNPFARYPFTRADAVETRAAGARLRVRALAARRHAADLRVRRDSVFLLPAIALVRPRRLVRERVPVFFDRGHRPRRGLPRDLPRAVRPSRTPDHFATIGSAILWSPFYAAADLLTRIVGRDAADGFSRPYVAAVAYGSAFYGFVAILLSIAAARRIAGPGPLAPASSSGSARRCSSTCTSSPPFSHACSAFAVALFVTVWLRVRERWSVGGAIALGLSGALMAMVREQDVFLALGPAVDFAWTLSTGSAESVGDSESGAPPPLAPPSRGAQSPRRARAAAGPRSRTMPRHGRPAIAAVAASPLLSACSPSFLPTRRSTGTSGRRSW